ncbi:MAG: nucleotidyltransferase family protein, partial [Alphaproteobacteria bacterium]|nr:nucleotidyltransferase family protein [Alphaproteobacteria bacterium]
RRLLGTVTDGDIRRAILAGTDMGAPAAEIMHRTPHVGREGDAKKTLLARMAAEVIRQIPLLDAEGRVVGIAYIDDLLSPPKAPENWVVLMAGGMGKRLRPLTESAPKPLLTVGDKPLLETILESFIEQNFKRFYISVNYKAKAIKDHFGNGSGWNAEIRYVEEKTPLGTAGALSLIPERLASPLIVMNGDLLTQVNFPELLRYHHQQGSQATMCVREYDFQVPFGVVEIEDDQVKAIDEKPVHRFFVNAGIYVLEPDLIDLVPKDTPFDMTTLFERAVDRGHGTAVFPIHEYWLDVGRVDDLERANSDFKNVFSK